MSIFRAIKETLNPKQRPICWGPIQEFIHDKLKELLRLELNCSFRIDQEGRLEVLNGKIVNFEKIKKEILVSELFEHLKCNNTTFWIIFRCNSGKYSIKLEK